MGDFNLNLLHYNENSNCHEFLDLMLSHSFVPLTKKPTRVTDSTSTLIDNIFVNNLTNITTGITFQIFLITTQFMHYYQKLESIHMKNFALASEISPIATLINLERG